MKQPEEILKKNPGSIIFARYAQQLAKEGNVSEAILILEKGIKSNPSYAIGHSVLAKILHSQNSPEGAAEEWTAALQLDPQQPNDLFLYGKSLLKTDNRSDACKFLSIASRYEPDNTDILMALDQAMTGTDDDNELDLAEETTEALAEMYEMDVEDELTAHLESDDTPDTGGTAIVEALDEAQGESFFDEDDDEEDEDEDETLSETFIESIDPDETAVIMPRGDDSAQDIGDTMVSGAYKPVAVDEEITEGDDFDTLLKSFVDYDEENEEEADNETGDGFETVAPEIVETEDTESPESVDEEEEDSDDKLISGVYEVIQEEEEKAATEDYKSLLETFSGDEPHDDTAGDISEKRKSEPFDISSLDTIAPQTIPIDEPESAVEETPELDIMDEAVESAELSQAEISVEEIDVSQEEEAVEAELVEELELAEEIIPEDMPDEFQKDIQTVESDSIEPVEEEVHDDTVNIEPVEEDAGGEAYSAETAVKEPAGDGVWDDDISEDAEIVEQIEGDVSEDSVLSDSDETYAGVITDEEPVTVDEVPIAVDEDTTVTEEEPVIVDEVPAVTDEVVPVAEEEQLEDTEETDAGNIANEFPFDEYQDDVNKLMSYIDEDSEAYGEDEPVCSG